jgi:hypothetical protein
MPDSVDEIEVSVKKESLETDESVFSDGSLVWARLDSTPFWPAIVLKIEHDLFKVQVLLCLDVLVDVSL